MSDVKLCPACGTPMANVGAPIWDDYCPNRDCSAQLRDIAAALREAHVEWKKAERIRVAAPDLLDALKSLRDRCEYEHLRRIADAAIAKAEGQS